MPGLLDGIFGGGEEVQHDIEKLDPTTSGLIDSAVQKSRRSTQERADEKMAGAAEAGRTFMPDQERFAASNAALGMDPSVGRAILNRYNKTVDQDLGRLQTQAKYESQLERARELFKSQNYLRTRQIGRAHV